MAETVEPAVQFRIRKSVTVARFVKICIMHNANFERFHFVKDICLDWNNSTNVRGFGLLLGRVLHKRSPMVFLPSIKLFLIDKIHILKYTILKPDKKLITNNP